MVEEAGRKGAEGVHRPLKNPSNPLPQASLRLPGRRPGRFDGFREVSYKENQTYAGHKGAVVFEYEARTSAAAASM